MRVTSATALSRAAQRKQTPPRTAAEPPWENQASPPPPRVLARPGPPRAPPAAINTTSLRASSHSSLATQLTHAFRAAIIITSVRV